MSSTSFVSTIPNSPAGEAPHSCLSSESDFILINYVRLINYMDFRSYIFSLKKMYTESKCLYFFNGVWSIHAKSGILILRQGRPWDAYNSIMWTGDVCLFSGSSLEFTVACGLGNLPGLVWDDLGHCLRGWCAKRGSSLESWLALLLGCDEDWLYNMWLANS